MAADGTADEGRLTGTPAPLLCDVLGLTRVTDDEAKDEGGGREAPLARGFESIAGLPTVLAEFEDDRLGLLTGWELEAVRVEDGFRIEVVEDGPPTAEVLGAILDADELAGLAVELVVVDGLTDPLVLAAGAVVVRVTGRAAPDDGFRAVAVGFEVEDGIRLTEASVAFCAPGGDRLEAVEVVFALA